jgi:hypothetical protein
MIFGAKTGYGKIDLRYMTRRARLRLEKARRSYRSSLASFSFSSGNVTFQGGSIVVDEIMGALDDLIPDNDNDPRLVQMTG